MPLEKQSIQEYEITGHVSMESMHNLNQDQEILSIGDVVTELCEPSLFQCPGNRSDNHS